MKKSKLGVVFITLLIVSALIVVGYFLLTSSGVLQSVTSGCIKINSQSNPTADYTIYTTDSSYTCTSDECDVWGSMVVSGVNSDTFVIMRTDGKSYGTAGQKLAIDHNLDGVMESWGYFTYTMNTINEPTLLTTPEGYPVKYYNSYIAIQNPSTCTSSKYCYYWLYKITTGADVSPTPKASCQTTETCTKLSTYNANYNFCPNDLNNPYCSGSSNTITGSSPGTYKTDKFKILKGQTVTFNPKYTGGSNVAEKYIFSTNYDCACLNAIQTGAACDASNQNKGLCEPCPSGYTYQQTWYCSGTNMVRAMTCSKNTNGYGDVNNCVEPYTSFKKCDGNKTVGSYGAICSDYKTSTMCSTGQYCYSDSNKLKEVAYGGCQCSPGECVLGDRQVNPLNTKQYRECIKIGNCNQYGQYTYCPEGLEYNQLTKKCSCKLDNLCVPGQSQCLSDGRVSYCEPVDIQGLSCTKTTIASCDVPLTCNPNNNMCDCQNSNICTSGEIQCLTADTYAICGKSDTSQCLNFIGNNKVSENYTCVSGGRTGSLTLKTGCSYSNPSCSTGQQCIDNKCYTKQCNSPSQPSYIACDITNFESCVDNNCICASDSGACTATEYNNQVTKCSDNNIQKCIKKGNCYRWTYDKTCEQNYACTNGQCVLGYKDVAINVNNSFAINQPIVGTILVNPATGTVANIRVTAKLYDSNMAYISGTSQDTITDQNGIAYLNFGSSSARPKSENITINVTVYGVVQYNKLKQIEILKTLQVKPNCPTIGYVGREVVCTWNTIDLDNNNVLNVIPKVSVTQGGIPVEGAMPSKTGVKYTTNTQGNVKVTVTAELAGYLPDTESSTTSIQGLTQTQSLSIDNKDLLQYPNGISTGIKSLIINVDEVGVPADVLEIQATITTPSNQVLPLNFIKIAAGQYKTNYNFLTPGQTYIINGNILFTDDNKASIPISYSLSTIGIGGGGGGAETCKILFVFSSSVTSDLCSQYNMIAWSALLGGIGIIITIIIIIRVTRRRP